MVSKTARLLLVAAAVLQSTANASPVPDEPVDAGLKTTRGPSTSLVGDIPIPPGYSRAIFSDDFSGVPAGGPPSADRWAIDTGTSYPGGSAHWGTNEVQTYTSDASNLAITKDGTLLITPLQGGASARRAFSYHARSYSNSTADGPPPNAVADGWTSARIETVAAHDFACDAGHKLRMEARLRLGGAASSSSPDSQLGIWPAFWSLGAAFRGNFHNWPAVGEIDILEAINGQPTAYQTVHCGNTVSGGPCHESTGIGSTAPLSHGDWHTVAVEIDRTTTTASGGGGWQAESLAWVIDGRNVATVTGQTVGDEAAWTALAHDPKFLLLNVAVGGAFPDAVAQTTTPTAATRGGAGASMEVQYVAVFTT